tara:strand:+ start:1715 stop:2212 length:498 start_codon:yes stop_codon:yes gene_type:complete
MINKNNKLYEISLYPYRSLNKTGFFILMFSLGFVSFVAGIIFMIKGAWPVFGFFGLDVLLVYIFFKINFRSGKKKEILILTKNQLIIEFYNSKKISKTYYLDAHWLQIRLSKLKNEMSKLKISSKNKSIIIGSFLRYQEKIDVVKSLKKALKKYHFNYAKIDVAN